MKSIELEVKIKDKILSANGKDMRLDDSLYDAVPDEDTDN